MVGYDGEIYETVARGCDGKIYETVAVGYVRQWTGKI